MNNVLVTGATGFIGAHLVSRLAHRGDRVTCLVRSTSNRDALEPFQPRFVVGDLADVGSVRDAVGGMDLVINLAGTTKALRQRDLERANVHGASILSQACASLDPVPTLIHVSSLAAAGPCESGIVRTETDRPNPVSNYGKSKLAGEHAVRASASRVPTSIVRPPIVIGPGDRDGFEMFKSIGGFSAHFVPGYTDFEFSLIGVEDLCDAILAVAGSGKRISNRRDDTDGIYYAAADERPTYVELGRMIGQALHRRHVLMIRSPIALLWPIAAINEGISRIRGRQHIFNFDKVREASAGSWACRADRIRQDTGWRPCQSLQQRIDEAARWYAENGWLPSRSGQLSTGT